jgi:hypothetical protein
MTILNINSIHRKSNDTTEYALKVNLSNLFVFAKNFGYIFFSIHHGETVLH